MPEHCEHELVQSTGFWLGRCAVCHLELPPEDLFDCLRSNHWRDPRRLCGLCWCRQHKEVCGCSKWKVFEVAETLRRMNVDAS